jgi:hypothetical protein
MKISIIIYKMAESASSDIVITWNEQLEQYFVKIGEQSQGYEWLYHKAEEEYSKYQNMVALPVIVLSSFVGFFSVGSSTMFEGQEKLSGIVLGVVSLLTGILNTLGSYYGFSKKTENARVSSISYGKLYRWLSLELSLPRHQRIQPSDLLKMVRQEFERLDETAIALPSNIVYLYHKRFKDTKITHPSETNGLEKIIVFVEPEMKRATSFGIRSPINILSEPLDSGLRDTEEKTQH